MAVHGGDRLRNELDQGRRGGVFFLYGEEAALRSEGEKALVDAHLDPATADFNYDQLAGDDVEPSALASVLQTPPMMAEWRVVVVRDAQGLAGSSTLRDVVAGILESPPPGLVLILSAEIPARSKARFYEDLKRRAVAVEFPRLDEADLPGWLMERVRAGGLELDPDAARALVGAIGGDLGILLQELDKLRELAGRDGHIGIAQVTSAVGEIREQDRWAWFDLVGGGRIAEARRTLPILLDSGESGVGLVIGLANQLLRIGLAVHGGQAALSAELPPNQRWLARRILPQAPGWKPETIRGALEDLLRADRLLKSTGLGERRIMDELLLRIQARLGGALA